MTLIFAFFKKFLESPLSSTISSFLPDCVEINRISAAFPFHRWGALSPKRDQAAAKVTQ